MTKNLAPAIHNWVSSGKRGLNVRLPRRALLLLLSLPGISVAEKPPKFSEDVPPSVAKVIVKDSPKLSWIGENEFGTLTCSGSRLYLTSPRPSLEYSDMRAASAVPLDSIKSPIGLHLINPDQESLQTIASNASIRYLSIAFHECPVWLTTSLSKLTQVTYLRLVFSDSSKCPSDLLASVANLDSLAHLRLSNINVGAQDHLESFFNMPLVSISLSSCDGLGMIFNDRLANMPNLRTVEIGNTPLSKRTTGAIARCASVDTVSLRNCELSADALDTLTLLKNLRGIDLEGIAIDNNAVVQISKFRCLEKLSLRSCGADDAMIGSLTNPRLRMLWVSGKQFTNESVKSIIKLRELEKVDLAGTAIDDAGVSLLIRHLNLTHLGLSGTAVTDKSVGVIMEARVPNVDLYDTSVSTEGLVKLATASYIQTLAVGSSGRSEDAIKRIRDARPRANIIFSD